MFVDLHSECLELSEGTLQDRVSELAKRLPPASLTAIGGFPLVKQPDHTFKWCGYTFLYDIHAYYAIREALGLSAVLTYTNPKNKTLKELGDMCYDKKHLWALHWINISITFAGHPSQVELAFARDTRFMMSWPIKSEPAGQVFTATGGIKEWLDYTAHKDDMSFDAATRKAMHQAYDIIKGITP